MTRPGEGTAGFSTGRGGFRHLAPRVIRSTGRAGPFWRWKKRARALQRFQRQPLARAGAAVAWIQVQRPLVGSQRLAVPAKLTESIAARRIGRGIHWVQRDSLVIRSQR